MKFLKTCFRCKEIQYDYSYEHLKLLISCADNNCSTMKSDIEECALQLMGRMPLDYLHEGMERYCDAIIMIRLMGFFFISIVEASISEY